MAAASVGWLHSRGRARCLNAATAAVVLATAAAPAPAPAATAVAASAAVAARKTAPVVAVARAVVAAAATWPLPLASRATRLAAGTAKRSSDAAKRAGQAVAFQWVEAARYDRASFVGGQDQPLPLQVPRSHRPSAPPADQRALLLTTLHSAHQHAPVQSTYRLWYFCASVCGPVVRIDESCLWPSLRGGCGRGPNGPRPISQPKTHLRSSYSKLR